MPNILTREFKWSSLRKFFKGLAVLIIVLAAIVIVKDEVFWQLESDGDSYSEELIDDTSQEQEESCNTTGIELHGDLVTYVAPSNLDEEDNLIQDEAASQDIVSYINEAEMDESIKAIILEVDSYGGSAVAAEEISQAMKRVTKPTVALVRNAATSGAYWSATGANVIFASALSDVGGIGVTASYLDNSEKNIKEGLTYNSLSTGIFKDYFNPDKPLTEAERKLMMRDLNIMHEIFVKAVATNRKLDINKVKALADGSSMMGEMALQNGLIDKIGGITEVKEYLKEKIGEDVEICWYGY